MATLPFSKLCFGTMAFGEQNSFEEASALLNLAVDSGINFFDFAEMVSLLAYSPLAMGLLFGKYMAADADSKEARLNLYKGPYVEAECRYDLPSSILWQRYLLTLRLRENTASGQLPGQSHPLLLSVVIGATKASQLKDILEAREVTVTDEIRSKIDAVHQQYPHPAH